MQLGVGLGTNSTPLQMLLRGYMTTIYCACIHSWWNMRVCVCVLHLTSSLHPLRQVSESFALRVFRTWSTASDLFPNESRLWHSETAPPCGGLNTSTYGVSSEAILGRIQPTWAPPTSNRMQFTRQEPAQNKPWQVTLQTAFQPSMLPYGMSLVYLVNKSYSFDGGAGVLFRTRQS